MNGSQHYKEAERLLEVAYEAAAAGITGRTSVDGAYRNVDVLVAQAQVHATLALAAATAEEHVKTWIGDESKAPRDWAGVLGS